MADIRGLYAVTDPTLIPAGHLLAACEAALRGGARLLQYRDKPASQSERRARAASLRDLCRDHGAVLLINDDPQLAADIGAPLLGSIPLDGAVAKAGDTGRPIALGEGPAADAYRSIVDLLVTEAAPPIEMAGCTARLLAAAEEALDAADA